MEEEYKARRQKASYENPAKNLALLMGNQGASAFFRPILEAVKITENGAKAADNRNNKKIDLTAGANGKTDYFSRVSEHYEKTRALYGERARANKIMRNLSEVVNADTHSALEQKHRYISAYDRNN